MSHFIPLGDFLEYKKEILNRNRLTSHILKIAEILWHIFDIGQSSQELIQFFRFIIHLNHSVLFPSLISLFLKLAVTKFAWTGAMKLLTSCINTFPLKMFISKEFFWILFFCNLFMLRRIQNHVKQLRWSFMQKIFKDLQAAIYLRKKIHLTYLTGLWMRLWYAATSVLLQEASISLTLKGRTWFRFFGGFFEQLVNSFDNVLGL